MFKALFRFLPVVAALLLVSCSIPSNPPTTVTDPAIRSLYAQAVQGDGDALYRVSRMYGAGINGFPQSSWYASIALNDAASANQPQAIYDLAIIDLHHLRDRLTSDHARTDSYKDWARLEDELVAVQREVERAASLGEARAANTLAAIRADRSRYEQLTQRERANYVKCRRCNGEGMAWLPRHPERHDKGRHDRHDEEREYRECPRCHGRGYVRW